MSTAKELLRELHDTMLAYGPSSFSTPEEPVTDVTVLCSIDDIASWFDRLCDLLGCTFDINWEWEHNDNQR